MGTCRVRVFAVIKTKYKLYTTLIQMMMSRDSIVQLEMISSLLAPTRAALQDMINTCVEYANEHNLTFSTEINPKKSKTKCMIFLKKQREVEQLK